jgi:hypothetical protein
MMFELAFFHKSELGAPQLLSSRDAALRPHLSSLGFPLASS